MKWLKLYSEIARDPKMLILAFEDRWHYVAVLCAKADGLLDVKPELRDRMLTAHLGLSHAAMDEVKRRLMDVDLVTDEWEPIGWSNRQSEDATGAARKRRQRARKALEEGKEKESNKEKEKNLEVRIKNKEESVTVTGQIDPFEIFWERYPRKTKKLDAMRAFRRFVTDSETLEAILLNINDRLMHGDFDGQKKEFIPHPSTYLNGKRWEDEVIPRSKESRQQAISENNLRVITQFLSTNDDDQQEAQRWIGKN